QASFPGRSAIDVKFRHLLEVGNEPRIINILEPAITGNTARLGLGEYGIQHIKISQVRRAKILEHGAGVVLRVACGVASSVEAVGVILLNSVVGQGLARHLATGNSAPIGEHGKHQGIDTALLLQNVQDLVYSFVYERNSAYLNRYKLLWTLCAN